MQCDKIQIKKIIIATILVLGAVLFSGMNKASASTSLDLSSAKQGDYYMVKSGHTDYYYQVYDETDFFIIHVRLSDPYCGNSDFKAYIDGEQLTKQCDAFNNKFAWFYINTKGMIPTFESESLLVRLDHPSNDHVANAEIFNISIGSISQYNTISATAVSGTSISRTKLLSDPNYHILLTIGEIGAPGLITSIEGAELWPGQEDTLAEGLLITGSTTPGTSNTITANFSGSAERGMAIFDFIGYHSIGAEFPDMAVDIALSWPDPIYCDYSYNCTAYFNYTNMNFEDGATSTITWIIDDNENVEVMATTTINLSYPFQEFALNISSTTGQRIGDVDTFSVSIGDIWEGAGSIIWVEEQFPSSFLADCTASTVCDFLTGTSTFTGNFPDLIACGAMRGGCYLLKPGEGTLDLFRRSNNQNGGPYRNLGMIKNEIFSLASSTGPASTTFEIDLSEWGGRSFKFGDSDTMQEVLSTETREFLYRIIRALFYFLFAISVFVQITLMIRKKEES